MIFSELYTKLDFHLITEQLKTYITSETGAQFIDKITFLRDPFEVERELDKTEQMKDMISIEGCPDFSPVKDLRQTLSYAKIQSNLVSAEKILAAGNLLRVSRITKAFINSKNSESDKKYFLINELSDKLFSNKVLEHHIEIAIDDDGSIKDSASQKLRSIRNEINRKSEYLRKTLTRILKSVAEQDLSRDEIVSIRNGRSVIPVKVENKRKVQGIIHSTSSSGLTVFIEPSETIEINNEITELIYEEKREIENILKNLTKEVAEFAEELIQNIEIISELDFIQSKAILAGYMNGIKPEITNQESDIKSGYHPVLLINLGREKTVPIDYKFNEELKCIIVTGPNAGGKTVSMKTAGLLQLMLQNGFLVPVLPVSKMKIYDNILVSIGDDQSISNNLSSFSSHLIVIKNILKNASAKSLILIDEICSGTDPNLGSALSKGIILEMLEKNSDLMVTTHMGDLKTFAYETKKVQNASMEFDIVTLSPNYKFNPGIPGQSFTYEIAEKYEIPENIINYAKGISGKLETRLEDILKELSKNKQKYENLRREAEINESRLKGLTVMYETKTEELTKKEKIIIREAKEEAGKILNEAKKLVEKTIKEIREKNAANPKEIKKEFSVQAEKLVEREKYPDIPNIKIKRNDIVKLKGTSTSGSIVDIGIEYVNINVNGMIIKASKSEIDIEEKENTQNSNSKHKYTQVKDMQVYDSIDLRGLYAYEIEPAVEKFIYESQMLGLTSLRLIHGKGTGKLREEVKKILKKIPYIKSSRPGNWNEGDAGVTIIEI